MAAISLCQASALGRAGMTPADLNQLRKAWRRYWQERGKWSAQRDARREAARLAWLRNPLGRLIEPAVAPFPPFPPEFQYLTCGARTRAGTPCKRRDLYRSGRCKLHGGLSTGPTSSDGKARSAKNSAKQPNTGPDRSPCEGGDYGKASRSPCVHLDYRKAGPSIEPHVRLRNAEVAQFPAEPVSPQRWRQADAV